MEIHGLLTGSAFAPGLFYGSGTITGSFATGSTSTYRNDPTTGLTVQGVLTLPAGKHLELYFDDTTLPGSYTAINAGGTVTLGATLSLDIWDRLVIPPGETFTLMNKSSAGAVGGRFEDFAEGATLTTFDDEIFTISHHGGDGNDVVLAAAGGQGAAINDFSLTPGAGAEQGLIVFEMTATGMPGGAYDLEASEDLLNWTVVQSVNADAMTGMMNFHIAQPPENFPIRFFRVR